MRLLYVCNDFGIKPDGVKGASVHLRAITGALSRAGHELMLLSPQPGPGPSHPVQPLVLGDCPAITKAVRPFRRWAESQGVDPALARDLRPLFYNTWAPEKVRKILQSNPPDAIIERLSLFSCMGMELADSFQVPLLVEVNAILTREASQHRTLYLRSLAEEIETRTLRRADALLAVSGQLASALAGHRAATRRIHHIPNGVDLDIIDRGPDRSDTRRLLGFGPDDLVIGFVGSLKPWHGVELLLETFGRFRATDTRVRLLIVGSGPGEEELRCQATALGICESTVFTGAVPHEQVPALLRTMDIATAPYPPSGDFYFSPLKLFEYMAAGLCCVVPRLGQIGELIDHGENGLLYDPSPPDGLITALNDARCPSRRQALGRAARATIESRYCWDHTANRITEVLEAILPLPRSLDAIATT
ncbi:MAG: glycosyltransferase family 4 protein [Phycisphaerae bacterium]|nr:glycosyltransferase family 4 protein [Phycisphaerae bacterium]